MSSPLPSVRSAGAARRGKATAHGRVRNGGVPAIEARPGNSPRPRHPEARSLRRSPRRRLEGNRAARARREPECTGLRRPQTARSRYGRTPEHGELRLPVGDFETAPDIRGGTIAAEVVINAGFRRLAEISRVVRGRSPNRSFPRDHEASPTASTVGSGPCRKGPQLARDVALDGTLARRAAPSCGSGPAPHTMPGSDHGHGLVGIRCCGPPAR